MVKMWSWDSPVHSQWASIQCIIPADLSDGCDYYRKSLVSVCRRITSGLPSIISILQDSHSDDYANQHSVYIAFIYTQVGNLIVPTS